MIQEHWLEILIVVALIYVIFTENKWPPTDMEEKDAPTPITNNDEILWT